MQQNFETKERYPNKNRAPDPYSSVDPFYEIYVQKFVPLEAYVDPHRYRTREYKNRKAHMLCQKRDRRSMVKHSSHFREDDKLAHHLMTKFQEKTGVNLKKYPASL